MKIALAASLLLAAASAPALAASPFDGTWKADMSKAQFSDKPDVFLLKGGVYSCKSCTPPLSITADGAFHAVPGQIGLDEMAIKIVDAKTVTTTYKVHGKVTGETVRTVSADGKSYTYHSSDLSAPSGKPPVYTGEEERVAAGPAGSHAISGSWKMKQGSATASADALSMTLKTEGKMLHMSMQTGVGYDAQIGGAAVPIKGDPAGAVAALKMTGPHTLVETDSVKGKITGISTMTLSADGKTLSFSTYSPIDKTTSKIIATKQ